MKDRQHECPQSDLEDHSTNGLYGSFFSGLKSDALRPKPHGSGGDEMVSREKYIDADKKEGRTKSSYVRVGLRCAMEMLGDFDSWDKL